MRSKKLLALGMASLMIISTCVPVFAEESSAAAEGADAVSAPASGTLAGSGDIEGYVDKDVFTVTLPAIANVNFSIDPQELKLATQTEDAKYQVDGSDATQGYGHMVLFKDAEGNDVTKSGDITVVNKSTYAVDVRLDVKLTGLEKTGDNGYKIKVVNESAEDFAWGTDTAISMKVTPSQGQPGEGPVAPPEGQPAEGGEENPEGGEENPGPVGGGETYLTDAAAGVTVTTTVNAIADITEAYEVKGNKTDGYTYGLKDDVSGVTFNQVTFNLSGSVNQDANWANFNKDASKALKVEIAYTVDKHLDSAAPSVKETTINYSKANGAVLNVSLGAGDLAATGVESVLLFADGQGATAAASTGYKVTGFKLEDGKLTLPVPAPAVGQKRDIRIVFNDTAKTEKVVKATITE